MSFIPTVRLSIRDDDGDDVAEPSPPLVAESLAAAWASAAVAAALAGSKAHTAASLGLLIAEQATLASKHLELALRRERHPVVKAYFKSLEPPTEKSEAVRDESGRLIGTTKRYVYE